MCHLLLGRYPNTVEPQSHFSAAVLGLVGVVEPLQNPSSQRESLSLHSKFKAPPKLFSLLPSMFGSDSCPLHADRAHIHVPYVTAQEV